MPTAKPRYTGDRAPIHQFSSALRSKIRTFFPKDEVDPHSALADPADDFVARILSEADSAAADMAGLSFRLRKDELIAEQRDILKSLTRAQDRLSRMSLGYRRLLDQAADPLGCIDTITALKGYVASSDQTIRKLPTVQRPDEARHEIAIDLAGRVLGVLAENELSTAATYDKLFGYTSDAVEILKAIGDDIGLRLDPLTWRDIIAAVKT